MVCSTLLYEKPDIILSNFLFLFVFCVCCFLFFVVGGVIFCFSPIFTMGVLGHINVMSMCATCIYHLYFGKN